MALQENFDGIKFQYILYAAIVTTSSTSTSTTFAATSMTSTTTTTPGTVYSSTSKLQSYSTLQSFD